MHTLMLPTNNAGIPCLSAVINFTCMIPAKIGFLAAGILLIAACSNSRLGTPARNAQPDVPVVYVEGDGVRRPGIYDYQPGMTSGSLIQEAGGLTPIGAVAILYRDAQKRRFWVRGSRSQDVAFNQATGSWSL